MPLLPMISGRRVASGGLLAISVYLFHRNLLSGATPAAILVVMFFASSSAIAAYGASSA